MSATPASPLVGVVMGSRSDWDTMQHASVKLDALGIAHEVRVVSAHRTPDALFDYAASAQARGLRAIVAESDRLRFAEHILGAGEQLFEAMCRAVELHRISPVVDKVFPWTEAPAAFAAMQGGEHFGKIVLQF